MNNDFTPENNQNVTPETNQAPTPAASNPPYQQNQQQGQQTFQQQNFQQPNYQQPNYQQQTYQNQGQYNNPYPGVQQNFYTQNTTTYVDESGLFSENKLARLNGTSATIKVGDWLKADCISFLNLIPCIGSLAAIVIYFILAFSSKTAKSLKNRYVASLIWSAIIVVLYIIVFAILAAVGVSLAGQFSDYWNELSNL